MKKFNYIHCIFFLIKYILSSTDYDLGQYQLLSGIINPCITFDSSGFKIDEEIYIKITGRFLQNYIEYYFYDDENIPESEHRCNIISV